MAAYSSPAMKSSGLNYIELISQNMNIKQNTYRIQCKSIQVLLKIIPFVMHPNPNKTKYVINLTVALCFREKLIIP